MCGIAGVSYPMPYGVSAERLQESLAALAHRGPDDSGIFQDQDGRIALAHARLSILELSHLGHQPMLSREGQYALVFNGEIYNYRELREELISDGFIFNGESDTEVLLNLLIQKCVNQGDLSNALKKINGVFSFAFWNDEQTQLIIARDALGVKPLYYHANKHCFAFASEIKALQPLMDEVWALDPKALDRYLTFLWSPGHLTPAKGVHKLGPGEALTVKNGRVIDRITWYRLPVFQSTTPLMKVLDAVRSTEHYLRQAVHRQMNADVPLGAFLSGGLDSSSIVAFAREQNPEIRCFTIETAGPVEAGMSDDLPYARSVAKYLKVPLDVVQIDASRMASDLESMVIQLDEPLADPAPLNVLYISRLARECGIKVLLSGAGGDDLFTGYRRHRALALDRYWQWAPVALRQNLERLSQRLDSRHSIGRRLRKYMNGAALDGDARLVNYFRWNRREDLHALYSENFKAELNDNEAEAPMLEFLNGLPPTTSQTERLLALEQHFFLPDHNLTYTDKMSMAVGVEVRVPFLDLDLVEFAHRIPEHFKQRGSEGKWVLKKAMENHLPKTVIYRPKSGFGAPLRRWMQFELKELVAEVLSEQSLKRRGLFEPKAVQRLITANDLGIVDGSYTLLSLLCIEIWSRHFIDRSAPVR
jgi:asparagine synthase (glutamine-hydrolysing)